MAKGKLITITPDGKKTETRIEHDGGPSLEELQKELRGFPILVKVEYEGKLRHAYVDEDGRARRRPINPHASTYLQKAYEPVETVLLVGNLTIWIPDGETISLKKSLTSSSRGAA